MLVKSLAQEISLAESASTDVFHSHLYGEAVFWVDVL